ncbi:MAG: hypothetical protein ACREK5_10230 [Gemmatimonadota bacterium]
MTGVRNENFETHSAQVSASDVDVSGEWNWRNVEVLKMPVFVAIAVGVIPEGRNTHARCESAGTMTLSQAGTTFEGTATREFNSCETKNGQSFQQPQSFFSITDGSIKGRSIHFTWSRSPASPAATHDGPSSGSFPPRVHGGLARRPARGRR